MSFGGDICWKNGGMENENTAKNEMMNLCVRDKTPREIDKIVHLWLKPIFKNTEVIIFLFKIWSRLFQ